MSAAAIKTDWGVFVKDATIVSSQQGLDWWGLFRQRFEPTGRIEILPNTVSPVGDHVWIRCGDPTGDGSDSQEGAEQLRDMLLSNGVPKTAAKVCRRPKSIGGNS